MNYLTLKQTITAYSHRSDLTAHLDQMVANVSDELDRRLGTTTGPLIADTDTNDMLTHNADIYLYGSLKQVGVFTHNVQAVQAYDVLYEQAISNLNINYAGDEWNTEPPVITPYEEVA